LIYFLLKPIIRLALRIFCPGIIVPSKAAIAIRGPVLICANHPNSFLDAIIVAAIFKEPIHFLARGDAFNKPWHASLLKLLHMFPVYRLSEGKENLGLNETAFENSRKVLRKNGIVLIFIEGICVNKNILQPFKKGASRIAFSSWKEGIPVRVLPMGIAYDGFRNFGKKVAIQTGQPLDQKELHLFEEDALNFNHFNKELFKTIEPLIITPKIALQSPAWLQSAASLGTLIHLPIYRLIAAFVAKKTKNTVFYDSVLFGVLFFGYGIFLIWVAWVIWMITHHLILAICWPLLLPLLAYAAVLKKINERAELG
jgi:1-acyl-sn-glycerol-3-phosphate acyltransferase